MGLKLIKKEKDNKEEIYFLDFEEIVKKVSVIKYNKDIIVIPNICAITPEKKDSLLKRLLNSGEDFISVKEDEFKKMIDILDLISTETHILSKESRTIPKYNILINIEVLKENAIFVKSSGNVLEINGLVFTDSELDYQGFGLFTTKEPIFVSYEEMSHIKEILTLFSSNS